VKLFKEHLYNPAIKTKLFSNRVSTFDNDPVNTFQQPTVLRVPHRFHSLHTLSIKARNFYVSERNGYYM